MAEDNADYSKVEYWDTRYETEEKYDWFQSVYSSCLTDVIHCVEAVSSNIVKDANGSISFRVLHLGCGNSSISRDLGHTFRACNIRLHQVNVDYSSVVIEKMKLQQEKEILADDHQSAVSWVVGDIRDFSSFLNPSEDCPFHLIIDKGTMDALQADKKNPNLEDEIQQMLSNVDHWLAPAGMFVQYSWEIPPFRKYYTTDSQWSWHQTWESKKVEGSDMYYAYHYHKPKKESAEV